MDPMNSGVHEFLHCKLVILAKAGIQKCFAKKGWMPAFAGMTGKAPQPLD
jgi:hypothetical protein